MAQRIVVISGSPGSGKSTLAQPLASQLGFTLISKDHVKEALHDALGAPEPDLSWSRKLGETAMTLLWTLAQHAPNVVLEANFRAELHRDKVDALPGTAVEVFCACPPDEAAKRYAARALHTHPVHVIDHIPPEIMAMYQPLDVGPVITVDTTAPVDIPALAAAVRGVLDGRV